MAKDDKKSDAAAAEAEKKADSRFRMIVNPDNGKETKRKDFILLRAEQGKSRAEITQEIRSIPKEKGGDPDFRYQIVFQTTKSLTKEQYPKLRGGHPKKAEASADDKKAT